MWVSLLSVFDQAVIECKAFAATIRIDHVNYVLLFDLPGLPDGEEEKFRSLLSQKRLDKNGFEGLMSFLRQKGGGAFRLSNASISISDRGASLNPAMRVPFYYAPFLLWERPTATVKVKDAAENLAEFAVAALDQQNVERPGWSHYLTQSGFSECFGSFGALLKRTPAFTPEVYPWVDTKLKNKSGFKHQSYATLREMLKRAQQDPSSSALEASASFMRVLLPIAKLAEGLVEQQIEEAAQGLVANTLAGACPSAQDLLLLESLRLTRNTLSSAGRSCEVRVSELDDARRVAMEKERLESQAVTVIGGGGAEPALIPAVVKPEELEVDWDSLLGASAWHGKSEFKAAAQGVYAQVMSRLAGRSAGAKSLRSLQARVLNESVSSLRDRLIRAFETKGVDSDGGGSVDGSGGSAGDPVSAELKLMDRLIAGAQGFLHFVSDSKEQTTTVSGAGDSGLRSARSLAEAVSALEQEVVTASELMRVLSQELSSRWSEDSVGLSARLRALWESLPTEWHSSRELRSRVQPFLGRDELVLGVGGHARVVSTFEGGVSPHRVAAPLVRKCISPVELATDELRAGKFSPYDLSGKFLSAVVDAEPQESEEFFRVLIENISELTQRRVYAVDLKILRDRLFPRDEVSRLEAWLGEGEDGGASLAMDAIAQLNGKLGSDDRESAMSQKVNRQKWILAFALVSKHDEFTGIRSKLIEQLKESGTEGRASSKGSSNEDGARGGRMPERLSPALMGGGGHGGTTPTREDRDELDRAYLRELDAAMSYSGFRKFIREVLNEDTTEMGRAFSNSFDDLVKECRKVLERLRTRFEVDSRNGKVVVTDRLYRGFGTTNTLTWHDIHGANASSGRISPDLLIQVRALFVQAGFTLDQLDAYEGKMNSRVESPEGE